MERVLGEYEVNTVVRLAAQTIVGVANRNPVSTFESNIQGAWTLLEAVRRSPSVQQVVVASSDKAYGDQDHLPYEESTPLQGRHPYDVSKSCAGSHRADVCAYLRNAGGCDALRELLRGRRPELEPDHSRRHPVAAEGRGSRDPLGWKLRARLFLR